MGNFPSAQESAWSYLCCKMLRSGRTWKNSKQFDELKSHYRETLLDTRCFVLGCKAAEDAKISKGFVLVADEYTLDELEKQFAEFAASLFNILESKRIGKLSEKADKISLISAPLEQELISNDPDNR